MNKNYKATLIPIWIQTYSFVGCVGNCVSVHPVRFLVASWLPRSLFESKPVYSNFD